MVKFLRNSKVASILLTLVRIYLGITWTMSGWSKVTGGATDATRGMLSAAIKNPVKGPTGNVVYPWFNDMISSILPHSAGMSVLISWGELLVGLGLIFGCLTTAAAFFGLLMNFSYLLAGAISVNPEFIFLEYFILIAGFNAGKIGLDRWVIPWIRTHIFRKKQIA
ncbi:DoxX family protein [Companilactobacillus sp.]|jgi:thiosulfate dehydrogenase [quinone] large subunit|uniref:DoxX family protein n=1 Tax=Companilactobacillus sp. TaxID=2767905 RepID=UPI0025B7FB09|nr:DoxX family protein [Companilactobacillus sp.]MCH4008170.1 DoxX family protein [Companilactobacillus sp.]MCH4051651.1 DoxX family protein [Companilactobacillus sp.]MCH4076113.1 DoxX family protein [Companilactobacillus sp.]MCH4124688.1 DoxX family protein [Companilactobacillus sp.]MCH4131230.1 DoxX family protein [Companilactobacillus sp.]